MKNLLILFCLSISLVGCANTGVKMREHNEFLKKAKSGDRSAMHTVAWNYCFGLKGYDRNDKVTRISPYSSRKQCAYWWGEFVNKSKETPSNYFKNKSPDYNPYRFGTSNIAARVLELNNYSDEVKKVWYESEEKIQSGFNAPLAIALISAYSMSYASNEKIKLLSMKLCDMYDFQDACSLNARIEYYYGDKAKAMEKYEIATDNYNWRHDGLLMGLLYQPELVPESLADTNLSDLYNMVEKSMKYQCKAIDYPYGIFPAVLDYRFKIHGTDEGLSKTECTKFFRKDLSAIKQRAEFLNMYRLDKELNLDIRQDKYKIGAVNSYKDKNFQESVLYFELLEKTGYKIPVGMLYHRANALRESGDNESAKKQYIEYVNKAGKNGTYYRKALAHINEI